MKNLTIILIALLATACSTTRHLQSESKIDSNTIITRHDSTTRLDVYNYIVDKIVSQVDHSKIRIITYYPADTAGKQAIQSDIVIDNDITTTIAESTTAEHTTIESAGSKEQRTDNVTIEQMTDLQVEKTGIPLKKYLIICTICAAVILFLIKISKIYFKKLL